MTLEELFAYQQKAKKPKRVTVEEIKSEAIAVLNVIRKYDTKTRQRILTQAARQNWIQRKAKMKTEKEIRDIYEEEKKNLDDCVLDDNDYYILQGWVEALKCVLS